MYIAKGITGYTIRAATITTLKNIPIVGGKCELTGMIDISNEIGIEGSFILIVQGHTWKNDAFLNPDGAGAVKYSNSEGSMMYVLKGLER